MALYRIINQGVYMAAGRLERDPERPVYVISVAATLVSAHPRTLRIYEDEGLLCPARTPCRTPWLMILYRATAALVIGQTGC